MKIHSPHIFHTFAALVVGLCLWLHGVHLAEVEEVQAPETAPQQLPAGSLFVIEPGDFKGWSVDGRPLTEVAGGRLLGATPLNQSTVTLSAYRVQKDSPKRVQTFYHQVELSFEPHQTRHKALRIPPNRWTRLQSDQSLELSQTQREVFRRLILTSPKDGPLGCWQPPLNSKVTSPFGSARVLPNGKMYHHAGLDLRAPVGRVVLAAAPGTVKLVDQFVVSGGIVALHHGKNLTSVYAHLSQKDVAVGDQLSAGQPLGLSGATGRVTGPHLHWEVYWRDRAVSPLHALEILADLCDPG